MTSYIAYGDFVLTVYRRYDDVKKKESLYMQYNYIFLHFAITTQSSGSSFIFVYPNPSLVMSSLIFVYPNSSLVPPQEIPASST